MSNVQDTTPTRFLLEEKAKTKQQKQKELEEKAKEKTKVKAIWAMRRMM